MKSKNIYITQHLINQIELDNVDHELRTEFGFKYELDNDFIVTNEDTLINSVDHDSEIVNIDTLIDSLETLKKMGSTHVAVDWHCDHVSYEIYGYRVNFAEDHEIESYQNKMKENELKRNQIAELKERLRQLNSEL